MSLETTENSRRIASQEAFIDWVDEQSVDFVVTTFSCRTKRFDSSDLIKILRGSKSWKDFERSCKQDEIVSGYSETVRALDRKYLNTSQRKKDIKLLRVPYLGGDLENGVHYHIHSLIELPRGESIDGFASYMRKIFQSKMESLLKSGNSFTVESSVWCEPYDDDNESFLKYCGRFEGTALSVGLEKVVLPQLIMNPPMRGSKLKPTSVLM